MIEGLTGLLKSRKAIVLVIIVGIAAAMLHLGHIDAEQFTSLLKVLVPGWMLAHAGEQGAKSIANGKTPPAPPEPVEPSSTSED